MDDMDAAQALMVGREEALMRQRRERADAEARIVPPVSRQCDNCDCDIPLKRLQARPTARLCVDCQEELESYKR